MANPDDGAGGASGADPSGGTDIPSSTDAPLPSPDSGGSSGSAPSKSLPPGRYWVTAFGAKQAILNEFFKSQSQSIHVAHTEDIPETSDFPAGSFYIFNVSSPVPWPATQVGFATIAPQSVQTLADTVDRPPVPESTTQQLEDALKAGEAALGSLVKVAAWGVGALLGFKLLEAFRSKK